MAISDDKLVERIVKGDSRFFEFIIERYEAQIFNLMYRYSGSRDEAADMTQDVFCRVYERLKNYQSRQTFFSWLYTLALNYAKDWSRKKQSETQKNDRFSAEYSTGKWQDPGVECENNQQVDNLWEALKYLPDDRQEMVLLRYRHEHSIREIAEIFSLSESAVKMRLKRSLEQLGGILK